MHRLADEIRDAFEERGWAIEKATGLDRAFRKTRRSRSSLGRDLVLDAIQTATLRLGLGSQTVSGGGMDVTAFLDGVEYRFRVRKAELDPDTGDYKIIGSEAILTIADADPEGLLPLERWVLGYTVDDEGQVADIFGARVVGITSDAVPRLLLSQVTPLGTSGFSDGPLGSGFQPVDDDSLGVDFDEDESDGDVGESDAR